MLLNKVVVGKGYKMTIDNTTLTEPPAGYDSVSITTVIVRWGTNQGLGPGGSRCSLEL